MFTKCYLFAVAKSKSLFDDPAAEISELSFVITQVQTINQVLPLA